MLASLLLAVLAAHGHEPPAYPLGPAPLRSLIQEADLIAVAVPGPTAADGEGRRTVLTILRQLKGDVEEEKLAVHAQSTMCNSDALFTEGQTVLVFLELADGAWRCCSLEFGAKTVAEENLRAYENWIRQYLALGALKNERARDRAELDWIVRLAADPLTRWDGASELRDAGTGFARRLAPEQRAGLMEALLAAPRLDAGSMELFEFLRDEPDPRLMVWMLDCLEMAAVAPSEWEWDPLESTCRHASLSIL